MRSHAFSASFISLTGDEAGSHTGPSALLTSAERTQPKVKFVSVHLEQRAHVATLLPSQTSRSQRFTLEHAEPWPSPGDTAFCGTETVIGNIGVLGANRTRLSATMGNSASAPQPTQASDSAGPQPASASAAQGPPNMSGCPVSDPAARAKFVAGVGPTNPARPPSAPLPNGCPMSDKTNEQQVSAHRTFGYLI